MLRTIKGEYSEDQHGEFISAWNDYLSGFPARVASYKGLLTPLQQQSAQLGYVRNALADRLRSGPLDEISAVTQLIADQDAQIQAVGAQIQALDKPGTPAQLNIVTLDDAGSAAVLLTYDDSVQEDVDISAEFVTYHPPVPYGEA